MLRHGETLLERRGGAPCSPSASGDSGCDTDSSDLPTCLSSDLDDAGTPPSPLAPAGGGDDDRDSAAPDGAPCPGAADAIAAAEKEEEEQDCLLATADYISRTSPAV
ncbi:hypothetical protein MNEG_8380, partial [Monoraphidium neglectum]